MTSITCYKAFYNLVPQPLTYKLLCNLGGDDGAEGDVDTCEKKSSSRTRRLQCNSAPHPSAPINFDDYDWIAADAFGQPAKRRKYVTKKTTEHNDAAAVLSLAPLIEVIGSSLDLENEGEGELEGGTTCSSEDVEREWEGDEEISSTSTETVTEPDDHLAGSGPGSASAGCRSSRWARGNSAGNDESEHTGKQVTKFRAPSSSSNQEEEKKDKEKVDVAEEDEGMMFFRAELLLTMRTPSLTPIHT